MDNVSLAVTPYFGKRSGTATCNQFDEATSRRCVQRAEEIARLAPESPEHVPLLGPQTYLSSPLSFAASTAAINPDYRAKQMAASMQYCDAKKLSSAGVLNDSAGFVAKRNSKGWRLTSGSRTSISASPCARPTGRARATRPPILRT
ncbi:MAG: hypothetical protein WKG07_38710 [Hymenobacter sp.]